MDWDIYQEQVQQIPDLIPMNTYDRDNPNILVSMVSEDKSDDNSIGDPQVS